jgi:NAD(P)-dependent dehydrogenase (short-subunit alcohol dehydrogenase family)
MNNHLEGKRIAVTGAFGSLGGAVADAVRAAGARVAAVGRGQQDTAIYGGVDLDDPAAADRAFKSIAKDLGGLDGLVNVAGGFRWETIADGSISTWDSLYHGNLRTAVNATQSALPYLLNRTAAHGGGRIINIGAAAARHAGVGMGAYAASKAGIGKLTEALAAELKDKGITVNAIEPGTIDTPANRKDMPDADFSRWVRPEQIADVIVFMLSEQAGGITGALIPVTGRA